MPTTGLFSVTFPVDPKNLVFWPKSKMPPSVAAMR